MVLMARGDGDQVERAGHQITAMPCRRSMSQSAISGRPTKGVRVIATHAAQQGDAEAFRLGRAGAVVGGFAP